MRRRQCVRRGAKLVLLSATLVVMPAWAAQAAEWTWTGGSDVDSNWTTPENWSRAERSSRYAPSLPTIAASVAALSSPAATETATARKTIRRSSFTPEFTKDL